MFKPLLTGVVLSVLLLSCDEEPLRALGQLESDRIELVAEVTEPIVAILITEGQQLEPGQLLLRQDSGRVELRITEARINIARVEAVLAEQISGPRPQQIDAAKATVLEAEIERKFRGREHKRLLDLRARDLTSIESVDQADRLFQIAAVKIEFASAQLRELEAGTRPEQIEQTRQHLRQAHAALASLEFDKQRLLIVAPRSAIVDSLPFEIGERPKVGDVVVVLLSGDQPYARIYVPEPLRVGLSVGDPVQISVDGIAGMLNGTVRRIASEASFTPYFALTRDDRGRLTYVAEIQLPNLPDRLPEGLPVEAHFDQGDR